MWHCNSCTPVRVVAKKHGTSVQGQGSHEKLQLQNGGVIKTIRGEIEGPLKSLSTDKKFSRPPIWH